MRQRTQSIAILNSTDDMTHRCRTPVLTSKLRSPSPTQHVKFVEAFDDVDNALWNTICSQNLPKTIPLSTVKRFLVVDEIYIQLPITQSTLLKYIP